MPYPDGNPTLTEQLEEDARRRFYTDDLLKEAKEMAARVSLLEEALTDIAQGNHVPDEMLQSKEYFREHFAEFLQKRARIALGTK